jgi:hypothetical protein
MSLFTALLIHSLKSVVFAKFEINVTAKETRLDIGTAVFITTALCIIGAIATQVSENSEPITSQDNILIPTNDIYVNPNFDFTQPTPELPGYFDWDCEPIPKGSWLFQELRIRGVPGIDPGPYIVIHKDGSQQYFDNLEDLPDLVYPDESFCIPKRNTQTNLLESERKHTVIYESDKAQLKTANKNSINVVAKIRNQFNY